MNLDRRHDEAQFQWLKYQLDSRVKLLPTLVAKWLERWQTCSASLRTAFMFGQTLIDVSYIFHKGEQCLVGF